MVVASGRFGMTSSAPCTSIFSTASLPMERSTFQALQRRSIEFAEHLLVLQNFTLGDLVRKRFSRKKVVVDSVDLVWARVAGSCRDNSFDVGVLQSPGVDNGVFSNAAWPAQDNESPCHESDGTRVSGG